jgi:hypothetical protein
LTSRHGALRVNDNSYGVRDAHKVLEFFLGLDISSGQPDTEARVRVEPSNSTIDSSTILSEIFMSNLEQTSFIAEFTVDVRATVEQNWNCIHYVDYVVFDMAYQVATRFEVVFRTRSQTSFGVHDHLY